MQFDTIIRGGFVVTAADTFKAEIGISNGRIAALGADLGSTPEIIDASGLLVMPGGIDSHVHLSQPAGPGVVPADDGSVAKTSLMSDWGGDETSETFNERFQVAAFSGRDHPLGSSLVLPLWGELPGS